jgi:hypothetical protein
MPGSMTMHCSPAACATTQQFVAVAADGNPVMNTALSLSCTDQDGSAYRGAVAAYGAHSRAVA